MRKLLCIFLSLLTSYSYADCRGKIDVAPIFVHLDVLNFGKTTKTMDMPGIKADINYLIWKNVCVKPTVLYASNNGYILTPGLGAGLAFPYKRWCFTPTAGANYTEVETHIPVHLPFFPFKIKPKEKFTSWSPYLAMEVFYRIGSNWRVGTLFQYAWSRTHTKIKGIGHDKSNAKGPSYSFMIERDFNDQWSLNIGAAYNTSLTREKHGIRGYGFKLGLARWF